MKLMHIFFDSDLRGRQPSLIEQAKKNKSFSMKSFGKGDLLAFVNRKQNKFMVLAGLNEADSFGVLAYYRSPHDRKIDIEVLKFIPEAFDGTEIDMSQMLKKTITERFEKKTL